MRTATLAIPAQQHADQFAAALAEHGMLSRYHCGSPPRPSIRGVIGDRFRFRPAHRYLLAGLRHLIGQDVRYLRAMYGLYRDFDRRIARTLRTDPADAVIGYENCTLETFRAARALGKLTILDAASLHYRFQQAMGDKVGDEALRLHVNAGKDGEIALADFIICCSEMAKASYVDAGYPADRIYVSGMGAEVARFAATPPRPPRPGPLRLIYVGRLSANKGADLLADALERLRADGADFSLDVAADRTIAEPGMIERFERLGQLHGKVPHSRLPELCAEADLAVAPSRFDSFSMVVPEALAAGTPVLATTHVGAKDLIVPGKNGFVVEADDADALRAQLDWCLRNPEAIRGMSAAARAAGARADWVHYRARAIANVEAIFERHWRR